MDAWFKPEIFYSVMKDFKTKISDLIITRVYYEDEY